MRFKRYCKSVFESADLSVFLDFFPNPTHEFKDELSVQMRTFMLQDLYLIQFDRKCVNITKHLLFQKADKDLVRENTGSNFQRTLKDTLVMSK